MWYPGSDVVLDVSIPGLCHLSYFDIKLEKDRQWHITKQLVQSFEVNIRISQPSKVMFTLASPR